MSELREENREHVGFGKPPVKTRFKKGVSGNPRGRPSARPSAVLGIRELLTEPVSVRRGRKTSRMSTIEAILRKQVEMGLKGDTRAIQAVLKTAQQMDLLREETIDFSNLTDEELEALIRIGRKLAPDSRRAEALRR